MNPQPEEQSTAPTDWSALARCPREQNDFWIVTSYQFFQHGTLESATVERDRLAAAMPQKGFGVFHCKKTLTSSNSKATIADLRRQLAEAKGVASASMPPLSDETRADLEEIAANPVPGNADVEAIRQWAGSADDTAVHPDIRLGMRQCATLLRLVDSLDAELRTARAASQQTDDVAHHMHWLGLFIEGMTAENWHDMRLKAERTLRQLTAALNPNGKAK